LTLGKKELLRAFDDGFTISADGETARVVGEMELTIVRAPTMLPGINFG
jgi:hypothetical protein